MSHSRHQPAGWVMTGSGSRHARRPLWTIPAAGRPARGPLEREHTIAQGSEFARGGHFAAMEAPDLLVDDVRAFFGKLR